MSNEDTKFDAIIRAMDKYISIRDDYYEGLKTFDDLMNARAMMHQTVRYTLKETPCPAVVPKKITITTQKR